MKRRHDFTSPVWTMASIAHSPLRSADPRTKLALSLAASLGVMLPPAQLLIAMLLYTLLLAWARLLPPAARQVWRMKWLLLGLFSIDWLLVSPEHASLVALRLILLAGSFTLFFATTTPTELRLALEWAHFSKRYAFSISLAFQSLGLLDQEWRAILEAQRARGAWQAPTGWRRPVENVRNLIALSVPAVVMTTRRAWALTEAAYARGFGSPQSQPYRQLSLKALDWALLAGLLAASLLLVFGRLM